MKDTISIIGCNLDSEKLIEFCERTEIEIKCVLNDYTLDTTYMGIPIFRTDQLEIGAVVVNCVSSISPVDVRNVLLSKGANVLDLVDFYELNSTKIRPIMCEYLSANRNDFPYQFHDKTSNAQFSAVSNYLKTGQTKYMDGFKNCIDIQYLDIVSKIKPKKIIDCGGFDGDTSELFIKNIEGIERIHFFEPMPANMGKARKRLSGLNDLVEFYPLGLSQANMKTRITSEGSASKVNTESGVEIQLNTLDSLDLEPVDLIKIDIEGHEMEMLLGAREYIKKCKPNIAIAVYHKPDDVVIIPRFLMELNPNYKIIFRHYTQGWSESVMYFINDANISFD